MVQIRFRYLWAKGDSDKIIWLYVVQIARVEEVDDGERFIGQR